MAKSRKSLHRDKRTSQSRIRDTAWAISDVLREARFRKQLSQQKLAGKLGLRQRQISDLERGAIDARLSTIQNVARALDLELMLIPRHLISPVEALQRAGSDAGKRPLYALEDETDAAPDEASHVEVGDTREFSRSTEHAPRSRKRSRR
jgi:transcriptional regulator with XRE-family HTH domain